MTRHDVGLLAEGSAQREREAQAAMAEADRFEREWEEVQAARAWLQAVIYHPDRWVLQAAAQRLLAAVERLQGDRKPRSVLDEDYDIPF